MLPVRLEPPASVKLYSTVIKICKSRLRLCRGLSCGLSRHRPAPPVQRPYAPQGRLTSAQSLNTTRLASASGGPPQNTTNIAPNQPRARASSSNPPSGGNGGSDPEDEPDNSSNSLQIGLDPFSQQLMMSALMAGAAWAIAAGAHLELTSALRPAGEAVAIALQLSAPVVVLLLAVVAPRWAPPFKGPELERLRHNYYMTAQVLQLYLDLDDEDEDGNSSSSGSWAEGSSSGGSGERARVRRRLRLEQMVGWGTISSGLALMQAFTLQPWNPPTPNMVFGLALAGRSAQQLATEFLVRGAGWALLSGWIAEELQSADASNGILFFGRVFGGPDAVKYAAGLALVALAVPGALWEARAARNFVRASVVGPVRDAAIFCTGNGMDEPAYCDPRGFAMLAARRPANAASVADVVTRTRGWRSGPEASYSSVGSIGGSMDDEGGGQHDAANAGIPAAVSPAADATSTANPTIANPTAANPPAAAAAAEVPSASVSQLPRDASASASSSVSSSSVSSSPSAPVPPSPPPATSPSPSPSPSTLPPTPTPPSITAVSRSNCDTQGPPSPSHSAPPQSNASSPSSSSASPPVSSAPVRVPSTPLPLPRVGPTLAASSTAFEWDSEDMSVLLRVETLQDKIALWCVLYYQLLTAFAINGAFLASDCNLFASFLAAWLLRTGPLLLSELRARAAADAAMRS